MPHKIVSLQNMHLGLEKLVLWTAHLPAVQEIAVLCNILVVYEYISLLNEIHKSFLETFHWIIMCYVFYIYISGNPEILQSFLTV